MVMDGLGKIIKQCLLHEADFSSHQEPCKPRKLNVRQNERILLTNHTQCTLDDATVSLLSIVSKQICNVTSKLKI